MIIYFPKSSGDGATYLKVAENIYYNFCISLSNPETKECVPHWGGNQGPLYPVFISISWFVLGKSLGSIYLGQLLILILSIYIFCKNLNINNLNKFFIIFFFIFK